MVWKIVGKICGKPDEPYWMGRFIENLDEQFTKLHKRTRDLVAKTSPELLYLRPENETNSTLQFSCGEYILRSAAAVEQTFGGLTANLWDDPFEWTLPEALASPDKVIEYLDEVEDTRHRGFELFKSDEELWKEIMAPSGNTLLLSLVLDTLVRAAHYLGAAEATFELLRHQV